MRAVRQARLQRKSPHMTNKRKEKTQKKINITRKASAPSTFTFYKTMKMTLGVVIRSMIVGTFSLAPTLMPEVSAAFVPVVPIVVREEPSHTLPLPRLRCEETMEEILSHNINKSREVLTNQFHKQAKDVDYYYRGVAYICAFGIMILPSLLFWILDGEPCSFLSSHPSQRNICTT